MNKVLANAVEHWHYLEPLVNPPKGKEDYDVLVIYLDELLDMVGDNERHPLMGLVDIVSDQIMAYEAEYHQEPLGSGLDALRFLMQEHGLTQSDLKQEIGSQGVVSEILNGRRKLTVKHIKNLASRFQVSPETFID